MAKRSSNKGDGFVKDEIALGKAKKYNTVRLRNIFGAKVRLRGPVTGKLYEWNGAGVVVKVNSEDVDGLINKRVGTKGCCGGNLDGNRLFEIVK